MKGFFSPVYFSSKIIYLFFFYFHFLVEEKMIGFWGVTGNIYEVLWVLSVNSETQKRKVTRKFCIEVLTEEVKLIESFFFFFRTEVRSEMVLYDSIFFKNIYHEINSKGFLLTLYGHYKHGDIITFVWRIFPGGEVG